MSTQTPARRREHRAAYQAVSAKRATRYAEPWTPSEDWTLLYGPGTVLERASSIGRTYYAAQNRIAFLRAPGAPVTPQ